MTDMVKKLGDHVAGVRREALVSIYQYSKSNKLWWVILINVSWIYFEMIPF